MTDLPQTSRPGPLRLSAEFGAMLRIALPLAGAQLAQAALHVTDTVMLGWYGTLPLAAVVLGATSFFIIYVLGSGFARAVMPLAASAGASGQEAEVRRVTRMGLWLSAAFGILVYPVFWWSGPILLALGQAPEVAEIAQTYMRIAGLGMVPALFVTTLQSFFAARGHSGTVLVVTVLAVLVNALLNWLLIFGNAGFPELGAAGAAIATTLAQLVSLAALAAVATRAPDLAPYRLFQRFWRIDRPALSRVFRIGAPIGVTGVAEGGMFQASALMMGWLGPVALAAHGIALEAASLAFMMSVGLSSAATIRIAEAVGRDESAGIRRAALAGLMMAFCIAVLVIALFLSLPETIIGAFVQADNPDAPDIIAFGVVLLAVAALFQTVDALQVMAIGFLRGLTDTTVPMAITTFSYWVIGVPASYYLAFRAGLGGTGLWLGLTCGLAAAAVLLLWRFAALVRRRYSAA